MTASICAGGPAITVWRGEAYTATVSPADISDQTPRRRAASSSSRAIAPLSGQPGHQL